jgi:hypothetical protein
MNNPRTNLGIGREVYREFESMLTPELFSQSNKEDKIKQAADLVVAKPYVTTVFRDTGFLGENDHHNRLINLFKDNLWLQDYAFTVGKLNNLTIETVEERAKASAIHSIKKYPGISALISEKNKNIWQFLDATKGMALIESAFYSRIGGDDMGESDANKIDAAIMYRALDSNTVFARVAKNQGINRKDPVALWQFSKVFDLTDYLQEISRTDPYYVRRAPQLKTFTKMNAAKSASLQKLKERDIVSDLVTRLMRKHKVDPWLIKAVDKAFKEEVDLQ